MPSTVEGVCDDVSDSSCGNFIGLKDVSSRAPRLAYKKVIHEIVRVGIGSQNPKAEPLVGCCEDGETLSGERQEDGRRWVSLGQSNQGEAEEVAESLMMDMRENKLDGFRFASRSVDAMARSFILVST